MKKSIIILVLIVSLLFNVNKIKANYKCYYDFNLPVWVGGLQIGNKDYSVDFTVLTKEKKIKVSGWLLKDVTVLDSYVDSSLNDQKIIDEFLDGGCTKQLYACEASTPGPNGTSNEFVLINPGLAYEFQKKISAGPIKIGSASYMFDFDKLCNIANLNEEKSTGKTSEVEHTCDIYEEYINKIKQSPCYSDNCSPGEKNEYNKQVDEIKSYCKSLLQKADYINPCVEPCENLSSDLNIKKSNPDDSCGLSDRLISFIANLLKWVKFVIPVLVIIFGILDFIKAVGADKEDEMKKAQGKFAKRLIAAALIFIVPFILEFILNKMGFITEGCGILEF